MPGTPRDIDQIIRIARQRYEKGLSQAEIALQMGISEATVSRSIRQAFAEGILEVQIAATGWRDPEREAQLCARFDLDAAIVVRPREGQDDTSETLARAVAAHLERLIAGNCVVGVSDGEAVAALAAAARRTRVPDVDVVSLIGGIGAAQLHTHSSEITRVLSDRLGARAWPFPAPALVDTPEIANLLMESRALAPMIARMRQTSIALMGIGAMSQHASIFRNGTLPPDAIAELASAGAVGSICGRFYAQDGAPVESAFDSRTLAITLADLRRVKTRLAVATGTHKLIPITSAIAGGFVSQLGTDATTADALLGGTSPT